MTETIGPGSAGVLELYGLRLSGVGGTGVSSAVDGEVLDEEQPAVHIRHARLPPLPAGVGAETAVIDLPEGRQLRLDRRKSTATFTGSPLSPDELTHPYLGAAASVLSRWAGREVFHAGAFLSGGAAWAVVGGRNAGKSSLLAALSARDLPVLADDLVVTDGRLVFTGPRSIDLRDPVPGVREPMERARSDSRWRVTLPPLPAAAPFGGWIYLGWDADVGMTSVPASRLLGRIAAHRSWSALPSNPETLLGLAALPAWDLRRPADWAHLEATVNLVLEAVSAAPGLSMTTQPGDKAPPVRPTISQRVGQ